MKIAASLSALLLAFGAHAQEKQASWYDMGPPQETSQAAPVIHDEVPPPQQSEVFHFVDELLSLPTAVRLEVGGFSHHDTHGKPNTNKQDNFMTGVTVMLPYRMLGGEVFAEAVKVWRNSRKGTTEMAGGGVEWNLRNDNIGVCGRIAGVHVYMSDNKGRSKTGNALLPSACVYLAKADWVKLNYTKLGKDVWFLHATIEKKF